jgi:hypothetical protein
MQTPNAGLDLYSRIFRTRIAHKHLQLNSLLLLACIIRELCKAQGRTLLHGKIDESLALKVSFGPHVRIAGKLLSRRQREKRPHQHGKTTAG